MKAGKRWCQRAPYTSSCPKPLGVGSEAATRTSLAALSGKVGRAGRAGRAGRVWAPGNLKMDSSYYINSVLASMEAS